MQRHTLASYARILVPFPYLTLSRVPTTKPSSTDTNRLALLQQKHINTTGTIRKYLYLNLGLLTFLFCFSHLPSSNNPIPLPKMWLNTISMVYKIENSFLFSLRQLTAQRLHLTYVWYIWWAKKVAPTDLSINRIKTCWQRYLFHKSSLHYAIVSRHTIYTGTTHTVSS